MNRESWNEAVIKNSGEFLQSWDWGVFQEALGKKVLRFFDENLGLAQIMITRLPLGLSWAYVPRGPILFDNAQARDLFEKIIKLLPANNIFIIFEPAKSNAVPVLEKSKARQPIRTVVLNLEKSEEELSVNLHKKTRYCLRIAQEKNLRFGEIKNTAEFYRLLRQSAEHHKFKTYREKYFEVMRNILSGSEVKLLGVWENDKLIAAGLFYFFGSIATYLHAGSLADKRELMAPYFLQWEAIKYFKNQGFRWYDLWGIDEKRWPGVSRFKIRLGGEIKTYPGAYVKVLKPFWLKLYELAKSIKK